MRKRPMHTNRHQIGSKSITNWNTAFSPHFNAKSGISFRDRDFPGMGMGHTFNCFAVFSVIHRPNGPEREVDFSKVFLPGSEVFPLGSERTRVLSFRRFLASASAAIASDRSRSADRRRGRRSSSSRCQPRTSTAKVRRPLQSVWPDSMVTLNFLFSVIDGCNRSN
jgi:hypothetical protein